MNMTGTGFIVTKDTWEKTPQEQRDWIVFETLQSIDCRMRALERWNKWLSFAGGIVGGVTAVLGMQLL